ncbi:hypothetical protein [Nocardia yamanashiensis]|uniref:hypothetical protein n=1 Tax=Nocardia yamanashiensis TaxID=209247 RepID=UPI00082A454F|nr:hypothetical protein [Nocardia yamanashiensis]
MPSLLHEVLLELFTNQPELAARLLSALGWPVPDYERAKTDCADLTDTAPTEYRADRVVVLSKANRPVLAVVVEVQLRPDKDKPWVWPVYVATLRARLRCPVALLVLSPDKNTTAWASKEIDLGLGVATLQPLVLGPEQVPAVTDPEAAARMPELAVLSAIAHRNDSQRKQVFKAMLAALDGLASEPGSRSSERANMYYDLVLSTLSRGARSTLEALMTTSQREYLSDTFRELAAKGHAKGHAKGLAEGLAEGEAKGRTTEAARALITVLEARGFDLTDEVMSKIENCSDVNQLEQWLRLAVAAVDIAEVL